MVPGRISQVLPFITRAFFNLSRRFYSLRNLIRTFVFLIGIFDLSRYFFTQPFRDIFYEDAFRTHKAPGLCRKHIAGCRYSSHPERLLFPGYIGSAYFPVFIQIEVRRRDPYPESQRLWGLRKEDKKANS